MRTKLIVKGDSLALRFHQNSFLGFILEPSPGWDYKRNDEYFGYMIIKLGTIDITHLNCLIYGNVVNSSGQPALYSFDLDKRPGYKVFCGPQASHYK